MFRIAILKAGFSFSNLGSYLSLKVGANPKGLAILGFCITLAFVSGVTYADANYDIDGNYLGCDVILDDGGIMIDPDISEDDCLAPPAAAIGVAFNGPILISAVIGGAIGGSIVAVASFFAFRRFSRQ